MKKLVLFALSACTLFGMSSCDKAEKLLFQPFESPLNFDITIPVVNTTTTETAMGSTTVSFDLDSLIKANTDDQFDAGIIGSMRMKEVAITLLDGDAENNLSNFDYLNAHLSVNGGTPAVVGPFTVNAGATMQDSYTVDGSPDVRPFFTGAPVSFELTGKANKVTTHELHAHVSATMRFDK